MLVKNYDLGFTFEISDEFTEITRDKYSVFDVNEDTLHYFLYLDDDSTEYPFSIVKGSECSSIEEYEKILQSEVNQFKELYTDATVSGIITLKDEKGRRVERVSIDFKDGGFISVVYYTLVNGHIVAASTSVTNDGDEYEASLYQIFNSIKEVED